MPIRTCPHCDSSFSKIEHLKRHERSHTGEKPYQCQFCHKRFARGDVLKRHVKGHLTQEEEVNDKGVRDAQSSHVATHSREPQQPEGETGPNHRTRSPAGAVSDPSARSQPTNRADPSLNAIRPSSYYHPSRLSAEVSPRHVEPEVGVCEVPEVDEPGHDTLLALSPPPSILNGNLPNDEESGEAGPGLVNMNTSVEPRTPREPVASGPQQPGSGALGYNLGEGDFTVLGFARSPSIWSHHRIDDDGLAWLSAFNADMPSPAGAGNAWDALLIPLESPPFDGFQGRKHSLGSDIPDERFAKVARLWPRKRGPPWYLMQTLWSDAAHHGGSNLFSESGPGNSDNNSPSMRANGPQRGIDYTRRLELIREFALTRIGTRDSEGTPSALLSDNRFPSADTLTMCIDLYFQRFHPIVPFIHEPTFSARRTPNILLFPMCLIGLHLLDPERTRSFVVAHLLRGIERCTIALSGPWKRTDSRLLITVLGSAALFLSYASILEECAHLEQTYSLYVKAITIAQQNGLFEVSKGPPLTLILPQNRRDDSAWKAWARVESAKRVAACLILTDSFFTSTLGSNPIIRVDTMQLYMPCSTKLFDAADVARWAELDSAGPSAMNPPVMDFQGYMMVLPTAMPSSSMAIYTLLSVAWLCMADVRYRIMMHGNGSVKNALYPGEHFQVDTAGAGIAPLLRDIYSYHGQDLLKGDPNGMALWHIMCVALTANVNLFELAAGREGVEAGKSALDKILLWAQTPYARRACLHAAQVYAYLTRRRISDGTTFMSEVALFHSALVLGLYVYASPASLELGDGQALELLDEVDWSQVGDEGFPGWGVSHSACAYPPKRFISEGGAISFGGVTFPGGYTSARRVLLKYVGLLEEVGRWNWRKFRHILRVMSDSMIEIT